MKEGIHFIAGPLALHEISLLPTEAHTRTDTDHIVTEWHAMKDGKWISSNAHNDGKKSESAHTLPFRLGNTLHTRFH